MSFKKDFVREKLFLLGFACIFLGATPRRMKANAVGEAWVAAGVLVSIGLILLGVDHYLNRWTVLMLENPDRKTTKPK